MELKMKLTGCPKCKRQTLLKQPTVALDYDEYICLYESYHRTKTGKIKKTKCGYREFVRVRDRNEQGDLQNTQSPAEYQQPLQD